MNKNVILIILALVIAGALGYFGLTKGPATNETVIQPPQDRAISTQCPDAATLEDITNFIGTPTVEQGRPPQYQLWVAEKLTRLHEEFSRNPIRCDINKQYQLILKTVGLPQEGGRINYGFQASLLDKNTGSEAIVLPQLPWIGPAPWGNTYGPSYLTLQLKSNNILELVEGYQGGVEYYLVSLNEKKFKSSYSIWTGEFGGPSVLTAKKDNKTWKVNVIFESRTGLINAKGLAVNDLIFKATSFERPVNQDVMNFSSYYGNNFSNIKFNQDFSKIYFDVEIWIGKGVLREAGIQKLDKESIKLNGIEITLN